MVEGDSLLAMEYGGVGCKIKTQNCRLPQQRVKGRIILYQILLKEDDIVSNVVKNG